MTININPIAFTIGTMEVRWYGIMIALGVMIMVLWVLREVGKGGVISYDSVFTAALIGIPSGIIVSRLLHVVDNIVVAKLHPELVLAGSVIDYTQHLGLIIGGAGLTAYGAILGASLAVWIYSRVSKFQAGYLFDIVAPFVILAQAIGRVGCTINGCCYGKPTSLPWGIVYTHPDSLAPLGISMHPTTIYEIIWNLIVFGILLKLRGRLKPDGSLFLVYLSLYSLWRLGGDFLRDGTPFLFGLHQAQIIAIIVLAIAVPFLVLRTRWVRTESDARQVAQASA